TASEAVQRLNADMKSVGDKASQFWGTAQAKISADLKYLDTKISKRVHEQDVKRAEHRAERLDGDAAFAIDYAVASIEQAKLAVLDPITARADAEQEKRA